MSSGAVEAAYEYDSSGNLLRSENGYAKSNPFRFSTKFQDDETGLINYGARYYSAALGRFINRDPIEESGGLNLYGFCGNDGINGIDYLGNWSLKDLLNPFSGKNPLYLFGRAGQDALRNGWALSSTFQTYRDLSINWDHQGRQYTELAAIIVASYFGGEFVGGLIYTPAGATGADAATMAAVTSGDAEASGLLGAAVNSGAISTGTASFAATAAGGAAGGFVSGTSLGTMSGQNFGQALNSGLKGAEYGAISSALTAATGVLNGNNGTFGMRPPDFTKWTAYDTRDIVSVLGRGLEGAITNELENKNASSGFWSGAFDALGSIFKVSMTEDQWSSKALTYDLIRGGIAGLKGMNKHGSDFMNGFWSTETGAAADALTRGSVLGIAAKGLAAGAASRFGRKTFAAGFLPAAGGEALGDLLTYLNNGKTINVSSPVGNAFKLLQPKVTKNGFTDPLNTLKGGSWANGANWAQLYHAGK